MNRETVIKVRDTARDVIVLANQVLILFDEQGARFKDIGGFKQTAALRRRSMDLTRLLAELRQNK